MSDKKNLRTLQPKITAKERDAAVDALVNDMARRMVESNALVAAINYGSHPDKTVLMEQLHHTREIGAHMASALTNLQKMKVT